MTESSSTFDLLADRLAEVAGNLRTTAQTLNTQRAEQFASRSLSLLETERVHTQIACVPRDAVAVGDLLLVGFSLPPNPAETPTAKDVFAALRVERVAENDWTLHPVPVDDPAVFLSDRSFEREVSELFTYYAEARLLSLHNVDGELRMVFGVGSAASDTKTLRWQLGKPGDRPIFMDSFGSVDESFIAPFDFEWVQLDRGALSDLRPPRWRVQSGVEIGFADGAIELWSTDPVSGAQRIHTDPVTETNQDVGELGPMVAQLGEITLIRIQPYKESTPRTYVYNRLTRSAVRADAAGQACHQLPSDQGIIFPGGYVLQSGEVRLLTLPMDSPGANAAGFEPFTVHRSPNGEDLLYVYHRRESGEYLLLDYNLVARTMDTPLVVNGYGVFDDGTIACVRNTPDAVRVHAVSLYDSPYCSPDRYVPDVPTESFFGRIGNPELVRALGEILALSDDASNPPFAAEAFEAIVARSTRLTDAFGWLADDEAGGIAALLIETRRAAGAVLDEFAAVTTAKQQAKESERVAKSEATDYIAGAGLEIRDAEAFLDRIDAGRVLLGRLSAVADQHYVDADAIGQLVNRVSEAHSQLSGRAIAFFDHPDAMTPYVEAFTTIDAKARDGGTAIAVSDGLAELDAVGSRLAGLTEIVGGLETPDPTRKTAVLAALSGTLSQRNSVRAGLEAVLTERRTAESAAEFQAAMAVLGERANAALMSARRAADVDAALTTLLAELETLDLKCGDIPEFADLIASRRDELATSFGQRRESLSNERTSLLDRVEASARRVLDTVRERAAKLADAAAVDGYFATDPLVGRVRANAQQLRDEGEGARATTLETALDEARNLARRAVADRSDLFVEGKVRLGKWAFETNDEPFELRLVRRHDPANAIDAWHDEYLDLADQIYPTETPTMSRALCLALDAYQAGIRTVASDPGPVSGFAAGLAEDGYELGVHDVDATRILAAITPVIESGLGTPGTERAVAAEWWRSLDVDQQASVRSALAAVSALGHGRARDAVITRFGPDITAIAESAGLDCNPGIAIDELAIRPGTPVASAHGRDRAEALAHWAQSLGVRPSEATFADVIRWIWDLDPALSADQAAEAAMVARDPAARVLDGVNSTITIDGLISIHPTIAAGSLEIEVGRAVADHATYTDRGRGRFADFRSLRRNCLESWRAELGVDGLRPKVLSSFVRNRLIDDVYLPLIAENLAVQLGMNGPNSGLLMLISPPGYGKTTLVEYVCDLLGVALVKINGPALGTAVTGLDPAAAPDRASAEELVKLNRALAMADNCVLYVDDIQHTSPEFLQKFIPLCDATRRIEGVLGDEAVTYSLAGKRFAVVMAGNPFTSDGATFRVPDMLANRADIHNLGQVAAGRASAAFARSYLDIACGVNETLAPLLARDRGDLDAVLSAADGTAPRSDQLAHPYSANQLADMLAAAKHLRRVADVLLLVNNQYIESASTSNALRGEPPFMLQGSYRNMARLAAKVLPKMTDAEVDALIHDHYRVEAQTLGASAGWNLAKLAEVLEPVMGPPEGATRSELARLRTAWLSSDSSEDPMRSLAAAVGRIADAFGPNEDAAPSDEDGSAGPVGSVGSATAPTTGGGSAAPPEPPPQ